MNFVLTLFILYSISLHYVSSQYDVYSQLFRPYSSYSRYAQPPPMFRYPQPTAVRYLQPTEIRYPQPTAVRYSVYRNFTPENRNLVILKKTDVGQMQSHLDNLLSRMKSTMMQMNQEKSASKTMDDPNDVIYRGKRTKKTLASNRSASV